MTDRSALLLLTGAPITTADVEAWYPEGPFYVDTAGSWDGLFPPLGDGDWLVLCELAGGADDEAVVVSRRYTGAQDAADAIELAVDALSERREVPAVAVWARPIVRRLPVSK